MPFPLQRSLDPVIEPISLADMKNYLRVEEWMTDDDDLISSIISAARERAEDLTGRCLIAQSWTFAMDRFPLLWGDRELGFGLYGMNRNGRHSHSMFVREGMSIILPRGPVLSLDSITYKDFSGTVQTLSPSLYQVDLLSEPARVKPIYSGCWPVALWDTNSIVIKFTCGYQQTVTEILTLPAVGPFVVPVSRQLKAISLTSAVDASTLSNPTPTTVAATMTAGVITFTGGTANQQVQVVYQCSSIPNSFLHAIKLISGAWYENRQEVVQGGGNFNKMPTPLSAESLLATYELFKVGYPRG